MENRCLFLSLLSPAFTHMLRTFKEASSKFLRCAALTIVATSATLSGFQKKAAHLSVAPTSFTHSMLRAPHRSPLDNVLSGILQSGSFAVVRLPGAPILQQFTDRVSIAFVFLQ